MSNLYTLNAYCQTATKQGAGVLHTSLRAGVSPTVKLVRETLVTWNPIYTSILTIYKKLLSLGFRYIDGEIVIDSEEKHV